MKCPHCQRDTFVKDSRPSEDGIIRRRRVCENGHRFMTFESTVNPIVTLRQRRAKADRQKRYIAANREVSRENQRRYRLRQSARAEAQATGMPVETIYAQWGIA
jgi:transcriptional regulator NrdR family protein